MLDRFRALGAVALCATAAACSAALGSGRSEPSMPVLMQPGVALELARERAATLSDVHYALQLDVTGTDTVPGTATLRFRRSPEAGDLVVDFRGLALHGVRANEASVHDYVWENGHIRIPAQYFRAGVNQLTFRFASAMGPAGAAAIRFDDASDSTAYAYTLLVPADANQLFPSFDQPNLKARFRWTITAPQQWRVLANAPLEQRSELPAERARWHFAETQPISTYLAAFAAGPWHTWESAPAGRRPITLYARASRARDVDADTLITLNRDALEWLERYFGVGYPFAKYDMLLAPAFPFGGMEHPGAVFYNENRFVFREPPTLNQRLGRAATIYHEVAHQWFGDLVTMEWFDDLWLKEGFSTYMAAKMQDELQPGTGAWKTFYLRNKPTAYATDATAGTTPVWQDLPNLDLAKSNYGPIVYNKAPSILKQLDYLLGEQAFRDGVRLFLQRHAYGNATWRDLLAALEETSGTSLAAFGEQYILRAGMPVIEPLLRTEGGRIRGLSLVQRPARDLPNDPGGWWPGRVQVRLGYRDRDDVVLPVTITGDTTRILGAEGLPTPDYVFPNDGDFGYGTFLLDTRSADYLADSVDRVDDALLRAMVWGSLWDLVRERRMKPARFVELALQSMPVEADEQIAAIILGRSETALERYLAPSERQRLLPTYERVLLVRANDEALPYGLRKAALDALIGSARSADMQRIFTEYLVGQRQFAGEPLRQPSRWAVVRALLALGHPAADSLYTAEMQRDQTPDAERMAFVAGAAVATPESKRAYFQRYLDDPDLNEDWVTASLGAFHHPQHEALTRPFLRAALERLEWIRENRRIFFLPQWINAFVAGQTSPEALAEVDTFLAENPDLPIDVRRKVLQARDELERTVRIRGGAHLASPSATSSSPSPR